MARVSEIHIIHLMPINKTENTCNHVVMGTGASSTKSTQNVISAKNQEVISYLYMQVMVVKVYKLRFVKVFLTL